MTSKTNAPPASASPPVDALITWMGTLEVAGSDASAFLQRQCMNDVKQLEVPGSLQWNGLLSAKGRVLFLFRLLRLADGGFLLAAPATDAAALRGELQRYVLRSKVQLREDSWRLRAGIAPTAFADGALAWDTARWVLPVPAATAEATPADAALATRWFDLDMARGIPHVDAGLADRYTPQMLGLARLQAYSLSKGCYPGQEIVARTHYLGQQKREWTLLRATQPLQRGAAVLLDGREVGEVLQVAPGQPELGASVLPRDVDARFTLSNGSLLQVVEPASA